MVRNTSLSKQEAVSALEYLQQSIPHFLEMDHTIEQAARISGLS